MSSLSTIFLFALTSLVNLSIGKHCTNLPNGIGRLRNGIDITKLDLLPLDITADNGFRTPIIDFTCDQGKKTNVNGKSYDLPDQVISIDQLPSGWLNADVSIYKSSSDVTKSMSANANVGVIGGLFSASGSYKKMQHTINNASRYIEDVKAYVSASKVNLYPFWSLKISDAAKLYIDKFLPKTINGNLPAYKNFIKYFGTHFLEHGKYGGLIRLVIETEQSYYVSTNTKHVEGQAKGSFFKLISAGGGGGSTTTKIDTKFTSASSTTIRYYGGNTNLLGKNNGIPTWQPTVVDNPWLFGGSLSPIYTLITDNVQKESMKRAIEIHLDMAYLEALQRFLYSSRINKALRPTVDSFKKQIETLAKQPMPPHTNVKSLGESIKQLNPVSSYLEKAKSCFNWKLRMKHTPNCRKGFFQSSLFDCFDFVPYWSDTQKNDCTSNKAALPAWFNLVEICYKVTDAKCSAATRSFCRKLGESISKININKGCTVQWQLKIPSSAPLWAKNLKVCTEWYNPGTGSQCKVGSCTDANSLSPAIPLRAGSCSQRLSVKL